MLHFSTSPVTNNGIALSSVILINVSVGESRPRDARSRARSPSQESETFPHIHTCSFHGWVEDSCHLSPKLELVSRRKLSKSKQLSMLILFKSQAIMIFLYCQVLCLSQLYVEVLCNEYWFYLSASSTTSKLYSPPLTLHWLRMCVCEIWNNMRCEDNVPH